MKFTHARFPALVAVCLVATAAPAYAVRPTPAYRSADSKAIVRVQAPVASRELNRYQRDRLAITGKSSHVTAFAPGVPDTLRVAVFQVQFTDTLMGSARDSMWFANELEHVAQYYRGASRQRFTVLPTLDTTVYTLGHRMSYYGSDSTEEERVVELAGDVIALVDNDVDFSQFDLVFIVHAGAGQETDVAGDSPIQIWSGFYDRGDLRRALDEPASPGLPTNDTRAGQPFFVDNFAIVTARASQDGVTIGTLGVWTYQIGSRIGLIPLFDSTPSGASDSQGVGGFCLMGYGLFQVNGFVPAFPCVYNRVLAGWVEPVLIDPSATSVAVNLGDINTAPDADTVCIKVPITENEYYLVDNRVHDTNADSLFTFGDADNDLIPDNTDSLDGAEFDFFLTDLTNPYEERPDSRYPQYDDVLFRYTGSGMYIWHIDEQVIRDAVEQGFLPDDYVARKGVDLEEADGVQDLDRGGAAAFALGSHFDSYRTGDNNQSVFGPSTKPASVSNSGAPSGIGIETTSPSGAVMGVIVRRQLSHVDIRVRWNAASPGQPATPVNLDGAGNLEIVALSDNAGVFVFNEDGTEFNDADANPATVEPYIPVPGVTWAGAPAFGNLDGGNDVEIVAAATSGELYVWKSTGAGGVVYDGGLDMAAPPMLLDADGNGVLDIVITEQQPAVVRLSLIDATGAAVVPSALVSSQWPHAIPGQRCAPLAAMHIKDGATTTIGVAAAVLDTLQARMSFTWIPVAFSGPAPATAPSPVSRGIGHVSGRNALQSIPSAPAVGDIDRDEDDEAVVTTPSGEVYVLDIQSAFANDVITQSGTLRGSDPSAPVLGDLDGNGTLDIAVWDESYMYLLASNARPMLEWPRAIRPESAGEAPPARAQRASESPVLLVLDDDPVPDVIFPLDDGTLFAFNSGGHAVAAFPRVGPAGPGAAPSVSSNLLVSLGSPGSIGFVDPVIDSVTVDDGTVLSIQSLQPEGPIPFSPWPMARANLQRTGRANPNGVQGVKPDGAFDESTFIIYPNPVREGTVHARVSTNARATVAVSIHNMEGEAAVTRSFTVNPNGLPNTPFDEAIDVTGLKSGVYLMRIRIESSSGSGSLVKPFAIRR